MMRFGMMAAVVVGSLAAAGQAAAGMVVTGNFAGVIDDSWRWRPGDYELGAYNGLTQEVDFTVDLDELAAATADGRIDILELESLRIGVTIPDEIDSYIVYDYPAIYPSRPISLSVSDEIISIDVIRSFGPYLRLVGSGRLLGDGTIVDFSGRVAAGGIYGFAASNISSVPEPSTLAAGLLGVVLMGGAWLRRRKRQVA